MTKPKKNELSDEEERIATTLLTEKMDDLCDLTATITNAKLPIMQRERNIKTAREFYQASQDDLKRAKDSYSKKDYSEAVQKIQQSSEKLTKALGSLLSGLTYVDHLKASHKTPKVVINIMKEDLLAQLIKITKAVQPQLNVDTAPIEKLLNDKSQVEDLRKAKYEDILKLLEVCDKIYEALKANDTGKKFNDVIDLAKQVAELRGKKIDDPNIDLLIFIKNFQKLYIVGALTFPHENSTRYPGTSIAPRDYNENLGVVRAAPLFLEIVEQTGKDFEKLLAWYEKSLVEDNRLSRLDYGWNRKQISEVCKLVRVQYTPNQTEIKPYIGLEHIEQGTLKLNSIGKSNEVISNKFVFKSGQILFGKLRPYFRKLYRPVFDGVCSTDIFVIDKTDDNDAGFLFYFFANPEIIEIATQASEGTKMPRASWSHLSKVEREFPPPSEQRTIAKVLSDLDAKIELNHKMNQSLEQIGQALFKRWFVDFEFPDENGRPYKSSGGKLVDSELGKIPEGWEIGKLGSHISFNRGCSYTSEELRDSENALVTLKSIERGGGFKADGFKPYAGDYKEHHIVKNGDVVVAHTDLTQNAEVLGKPAIVREVPRFKKLIASMDLGIVRPNDETTSNSYLYYLLKTDLFQNHAYGYASGTTVFHLSSKAVPEFRFALAPKELVKRFSKVVDGLTAKIRQTFSEAEELSEIRDSLLPKLMSGKIRVPT